MVLEDRSLHSLEDRTYGARRSFVTLTRSTSNKVIFKGSARSSSEAIFQLKAIYKRSDLQGLCPIFKRSDLPAEGDLQGLCPIFKRSDLQGLCPIFKPQAIFNR